MSAPILLPGDWVYLRITMHIPGSVPASERDVVMKDMADRVTRSYNAMGVYVVSTDQVSGPDQTFSTEIIAVFRNGIAPVSGKAPGL